MTKERVLKDARFLLNLREELEAEEARLAARRMEMARQYAEGETERVHVPADEFRRWFADDADASNGVGGGRRE
jgi:hypothetical protein